MSNIKLTFDNSSRDFVLDAFEKVIDDNGYVVERKTREKVITPDGEEILGEEFAGIRKGSEIYIKSDLPSIIQLSDQLESKTR